MAQHQSSPFYDPRNPPTLPPGQALSYFDAPAAPHEQRRGPSPRDVSPLNSYEHDSYLGRPNQYDPLSANKSPTRPQYDTPYDSRDDIPLQTHYPNKGYNAPPTPSLDHQASDTWPLNAPPAQDQSRAAGAGKGKGNGNGRRKGKGWMWANIPWVTYTLSVIQIAVFIAELVKMSSLTGSPIQTKPSFNPMVGPSPFLLINMGARYVPCMRNQDGVQNNHIVNWPCPNSTESTGTCPLSELCGFWPIPNPSPDTNMPASEAFAQPPPNQWFRFITPIFLHGGFIHIAGNLCLQLLLGRDMEKIIGAIRFFLVYFSAGIFGFVLGGNYAKPGIASTGCSGALFGIVGLVFIDLFYSWRTRKSPWWDLFFLGLTVVIEIVIGLLPTGLDNFSHIGGLLVGLALGISVLHSPTALRKHYEDDEPAVGFNSSTRRDRAKRQSRAIEMDDLVHGTHGASGYTLFKDPVGFFKGRKPLWWVWLVFRLACLIAIVAGFIALLHTFYNTTKSNCDWCQKLSCIDYKDWCKQGDFTATSSSVPGPTPVPTAPPKLHRF